MVKKFLCQSCAYNWRGCHNPGRPNIKTEEGCKDFWRRGRNREPDLSELDKDWVQGLDLRGLGKKSKQKRKK